MVFFVGKRFYVHDAVLNERKFLLTAPLTRCQRLYNVSRPSLICAHWHHMET